MNVNQIIELVYEAIKDNPDSFNILNDIFEEFGLDKVVASDSYIYREAYQAGYKDGRLDGYGDACDYYENQ